MAETSASDGPATGGDFDMMSALDWKDGIATLPGSDIRVHIFIFSNSLRMTQGTYLTILNVQMKNL